MIAEAGSSEKEKMRERLIVGRGEIAAVKNGILQTIISSCVSVCIYDPLTGSGAITHIANSRLNDTTPSGRYIKNNGYFYADEAIDGAVELLQNKYNINSTKNLKAVVAGGLLREGPIVETLDILKKYNFHVVGMDIMRNIYRTVVFKPESGSVTIFRKKPFSDRLPYVYYRLRDGCI